MSARGNPIDQLTGIMQARPETALVQAPDKISLARWRHNAPYAENGTVSDHMLILAHADCIQRRRLTNTHDASTEAGSMTLLKKGPVGEWEYDSPVDILHVYLSDRFLSHCLNQNGIAGRQIEFVDRIGFSDPFFREALVDIERALALGRAASLFVSTIGLAVGLRVLTKYSNIDLTAPPAHKGALAPYQLRKAQEYIDTNLTGDATLDEIAQRVGLSAKHFARAFRQSTGVPPHRWLLQRRIERARELLEAGDLPLAEIALLCGFADQSHFTVTFKKATGLTPGAYRREARL